MAENHLYHAVGCDPAATINKRNRAPLPPKTRIEASENKALRLGKKRSVCSYLVFNSDHKSTLSPHRPPLGLIKGDQNIAEFGGVR